MPGEGSRPRPGQEGVHLFGTNVGDIGLTADGATEGPQGAGVRALLFAQQLAVADVSIDQLLEVHSSPPRSRSAT